MEAKRGSSATVVIRSPRCLKGACLVIALLVFAGQGGAGDNTWTWMGPYYTSYVMDDVRVDPSNPQTVYASSNGLWKSTDGGATWTKIHPTTRGDNLETLAIVPSSPQTLYFAVGNTTGQTDGGLFKTADGGGNWTGVSAGLPGGTTVRALVTDPYQTQIVYAGTNKGVFKTTDGGASWIGPGTGMSAGVTVRAISG